MKIFDDLEKYSNNISIVTESYEKITYNDLLDTADSIGANIRERCLIFLVCRNSVECVAGYLAFIRAGIVLALIPETIDQIFFLNLLEIYRPRYIFLPAEKSKLQFDGEIVYSYGEYRLIKTKYKLDYTLHKDLALVMSTSGSTGSPKFVRQTYNNIKSNAESISKYLGIKKTHRSISTMPMSYTFMLSIINSHFIKGASIILTNATLLEKRFWKIIKEQRATTFSGVPYTYEILKKLRFDRINLPDLLYITQAGGKLSDELSKKFIDICKEKDIEFYVMYGQTEATARMSYLPWEFAHTKIGSIGIAIPEGKFWLEDENKNVIKNNYTVGELIYKGDNVTMGYAENRFHLSKNNENKGILRTGDLAERDKDGFYYIKGRMKRFLKMYGNRVNLDEIEEILKIGGYNCVCAGVDNNIKIYITQPSEKKQIINYITKRIGINRAGFTLIHIDKIPRNDIGKVQYSALC